MSLVGRFLSKYIEVELECSNGYIALIYVNNRELYIDARDLYETENHAYITLEYYTELIGEL